MPSASKKVRVIKLHDMDYRGCAEPTLGMIGTIDAECVKEQAENLPYLEKKGLGHLVFMKFKATELGYNRSPAIMMGIPPDCFEEV